jgi:hypothetical protein
MINPNSPAFPLATIDMDQRRVDYPPHVCGLPIRLHLAAMAFQQLVRAHVEQSIDDFSKQDVARESLSYADALIAEYNRTEEKPNAK